MSDSHTEGGLVLVRPFELAAAGNHNCFFFNDDFARRRKVTAESRMWKKWGEGYTALTEEALSLVYLPASPSSLLPHGSWGGGDGSLWCESRMGPRAQSYPLSFLVPHAHD